MHIITIIEFVQIVKELLTTSSSQASPPVETDECTSGASVMELKGMNTSKQGEQTRRHARI